MSILGKIALALTIVLAIAACVLGWIVAENKTKAYKQLEAVEAVLQKPDKITITYGAASKFRTDPNQPALTVKKYSDSLNWHITELATTKAKLEETEKKLADAQSEIGTLNVKLAEMTKKADDTKAELDKKVAELEASQKAFTALKDSLKGEDPAELFNRIDTQKSKIDTLETEKKKLEELSTAQAATIVDLTGQLKNLRERQWTEAGSARVVAVNRPWSFVVLDAGTKQHLMENTELTVYRGETYVGKIRTVTCDENTAVADILPGWEKGEIQVGDQVIY